MNNQKGFANIILVVVIVIPVGAGAYFVSTKQVTPPILTPTPTPSPTPTPTPLPTPKPSPTPKLSPTPPPTSYQKQSFVTIAKQSYSGHNDRKNYVIKEISEWRSLWDIVNATVTPKPSLPSIDFNNEMVVAVFQGEHSTGGYSIEIVEILEKANSLEVTVKETSPSPGSMVTQAFTQPFHIVKIKRIDKEIVFMR